MEEAICDAPSLRESEGLRPFWVSWWQHPKVIFELHTPWWISGYRYLPSGSQASICAAVMAADEGDARRQVVAAHDSAPQHLVFRFIEPRAPDWSPYCDRFRRSDWMQWPPGNRKDGSSPQIEDPTQ